jgi:bifunctional NMN adenylyltransferase/nudix hydrolase
MTATAYDILVICGRFQPFHNGHYNLVMEALRKAKQKVVVFICSADKSHTDKNPFTYTERREMLTGCFPDEVREGKLIICHSNDMLRDEDWAAHIVTKVSDIKYFNNIKSATVTVVSSNKEDDHHLRKQWFPDVDVIDFDVKYTVHAKDIRKMFSTGKFNEAFERVPAPVKVVIENQIHKALEELCQKEI